jgi:hypothetical protein
MGIGEIGIVKRDRSGSRHVGGQITAGHAGTADKRDRLRNTGRDDRNVIGAGDRDGEGLTTGLGALQEVVVDQRRIGQRQRLTGAEEVERAVRKAVRPGRRAVVVVAGVLLQADRFDRLDRFW